MRVRSGIPNSRRIGIGRVILALGIVAVFPPLQPSAAQEKPAATEDIASLRQKAEAADARSQFELGTRFERGLGVPRDEAEAVVWYTKAANQGLAEAQNSLGVMYSAGRGVPRNYWYASIWYAKAAEQGLADAQHSLGELYRSGRVPLNTVDALKWLGLEEAGADGARKVEFAALLATAARSMTAGEVAMAKELAREWARRVAERAPSARPYDLSTLSALEGGIARRGAPGVYVPGVEGVSLPRLLREEKPTYTTGAMRAKIQGRVLLDCIVGVDGRVRECLVLRSLDATHGLDDQAIEAAYKWRFQPAEKDGRAVAVVVMLDFDFHLKF